MPARDYQETLRSITHKATVYIARYRVQLFEHMTPEQRAALSAFEAATRQLQDALGPTPIEGADHNSKRG